MLQNPVINSAVSANGGVYTVSITAPGCLVTASASTIVIVNQTPIAPTAGSNSPVCLGADLRLSASGIAGATYNWTGPNGFTSTLQNPVINNMSAGTAGTYSVTVTLNSCTSAVTTTNVVFNRPKVAVAGTGSFAPSVADVNVNYIPSEADKAKGTVMLKLTSIGNSCLPVSDSMILAITPSPTISIPDFKYILQGKNYVINPIVTGSSLQYQWTPDLYLSSATIPNPTIKGVESQLYNLSVTGLSGCVTQKQIMIYVLKPIVIPNTFTPNGDGINDLWIIKELSTYPGAQVSIFNRYGTRLYYSKGYGIPWDGTYNGKPLPFGTYYYIVDCGIYGPRLSGYIALVR